MEINVKELEEKIKNGEKLIVDFYTKWCGPCSVMKPVFERIASETTEVGMYTLNVEENRNFAIKYGIRSVPTIKSFNSGNVTSTKVGLLSETQIKELIENLKNG